MEVNKIQYKVQINRIDGNFIATSIDFFLIVVASKKLAPSNSYVSWILLAQMNNETYLEVVRSFTLEKVDL